MEDSFMSRRFSPSNLFSLSKLSAWLRRSPRLTRWLQRLVRGLTRGWVKVQPATAGSYHGHAQALMLSGQGAAAVVAAGQAVALAPDNPGLYQTLAEAHLSEGRWADALAATRAGLHLDPHLAWLHLTQAKAYLGLEQWDGALDSTQTAIDLDPNVSWFHYHQGEALYKSGQWNAAQPPLRRAIELDPDFAWSYYFLGESLVATEQVAEAIALYQQVTRQHPDLAYLQACLEYAQHLQGQEQRIQAFCEAAAIEDQNPDRPLRVLMLAPYPTYPPKLGAITRMFHEMATLGAHHSLVVACFIFSKEEYKLEGPIGEHCALPLTVMIGDAPPRQPGQPQLIHRYSSLRLRKLLGSLSAANFDIVVSDFIYMAQYQEIFPKAFHVLAEHNIESTLLRRCAEVDNQVKAGSAGVDQLAHQSDAVKAFVSADTEADLLADFENQHWPKFPLRLVVSEQDKQEMVLRCPIGNTLVVNNGVDTQKIQSFPDLPNNRILFIGTLSYYPNIDGATYFVEKILPHIWQQDPTVELWIAGAEPPQAVVDLGQDARIRVIANPEDMTAVAAQCCMTIVPLRIGSGTRIKILQSMAMGLPIVSTSLGCEGLLVADGTHLFVRDQPVEFARAVLRVLSDQAVRERFRREGRDLVEQSYDWSQVFEQANTQIVARFKAWQ
jgi:glycosyltransferase involved in cell wall biosynthesis/Flp pilus assembly protein TadD